MCNDFFFAIFFLVKKDPFFDKIVQLCRTPNHEGLPHSLGDLLLSEVLFQLNELIFSTLKTGENLEHLVEPVDRKLIERLRWIVILVLKAPRNTENEMILKIMNVRDRRESSCFKKFHLLALRREIFLLQREIFLSKK